MCTYVSAYVHFIAVCNRLYHISGAHCSLFGGVAYVCTYVRKYMCRPYDEGTCTVTGATYVRTYTCVAAV